MAYNTKQREILIKFFSNNHDRSFSAEDIYETLKTENISLSAIYRNLSVLEKDGKLRKTTKHGTTKAFYQYVDPEKCEGHMHISCTKCGKTEHLSQREESTLLSSVLKNENFSIDTNNTIIYGVCKKCK